jgi:hypothetical protein
MFKRIAVIAAVFIAACGSEKAPFDADAGPGIAPVGTVPVAAWANTGVANAKIAVKTSVQVFQPATQYDASTDTSVNLTCGDPACPTVNAACQNNVCGSMVPQNSIFFVRNVPATQATFQLPCDDRSYVVEVYGADAASKVLESHSATVTMASPCTAAITPTWSTKNFVAAPAASGLSYTIPSIYMGMEPPNNSFTVTVNGIGYPWSTSGWTLAATGLAAPTIRSTFATFVVPTAMAAPASFAFDGKFLLDASLTAGTDLSAGRWWIQVTDSKIPVAAGTVNLP